MSRFVSLLFLSLAFCCSPATRPNAPPQAVPVTDAAQEPPSARPKFAQPPSGWKELPRSQAAEKKSAAVDETVGETHDAELAPPSARHESQSPAQNRDPSDDKGEAAAKADRSSSSDSLGSGVGAMRQPSRPQPDERPGLGTTWGETRYSHVDEVQFVRATPAPTFNATLWYNDQRGASAMAQSEGRNVAYNRAASLALGGAVTMTLRNEYGSALSAMYANGRTNAIGEAGQRYIISLQNNSADRFEVVLSVDGLDVLDGREAAYGKRGYLIEPHGTIDIEGFRQSDDHVAAFRFGSVRDSYAARTGGGRNVGVIGCAVFAERGYYSYHEIERRRGADPFPGKWASPPIHIVH